MQIEYRHQRPPMLTTTLADRISVNYCSACDLFHLQLFKTGDAQPFAECSFSASDLAALLDYDAEQRSGAEGALIQ